MVAWGEWEADVRRWDWIWSWDSRSRRLASCWACRSSAEGIVSVSISISSVSISSVSSVSSVSSSLRSSSN